MNPPNPPKIFRVPGQFPTVRANTFQIIFDGGSFLLSAEELRPGEAHDAAAPAPTLGAYEVARLAISPASLVWLKRHIETAERAYEDAMKAPMPQPEALGDALNATAALNELKKPPKPNGPTELS